MCAGQVAGRIGAAEAGAIAGANLAKRRRPCAGGVRRVANECAAHLSNGAGGHGGSEAAAGGEVEALAGPSPT
eukprot:526248-Prorocentrum_minimum.AAC.1